MNSSSGIKRGLAASAISALAIAGLPLLASSASAAVGDSIAVGSVGPTLNGGAIGGVVVLKTKNITEAEAEGSPAAAATPALKLSNTALTGSPNSATQTVSIVGAPVWVADGATGDSNKTDGFDEVTVHVSATTAADGDTAHYAIFLDDNDDEAVAAGEARTQVDQTTSGALATIDVAPASQSAAQDIASGAYNVTLKDAAGRTTQLPSGKKITVAPPATVTTDESAGEITAVEAELGKESFTATGTTVGSYDITLTSDTTPVVTSKATLNVTKKATLAAGEVDIVTGADSWNGFGGGNFGAPSTKVRVDQSSIRIDFKSTDAAQDGNTTVTLTATGTGTTFGGQAAKTYSTVLDANGVGSITITPDAGTIQHGDSIALSGAFAETLDFARAAVTDFVPTANPYFSKVGGSVDVTIKVVDQFGQPVTTGFVEAARDGVNAAADATPQRKAVGSDGTATFTFTDTKAVNGAQENVDVAYFKDGFSATADNTEANATVIKYTTEGMGSNFKTTFDGTFDTEATGYKASDVTVIPLADGVANNDAGSDESVVPTLTNGEVGSEVTISVDNGAKILKGAATELAEGTSSITDTIAVGGGLTNTYKFVGTKSGVVTVTVTSAHRTETAQFTVLGQTDTSTARNVTVSGPAEVASGTSQTTFTAVVTDAFGNAIPGFDAWNLHTQVSGPGEFKDSDFESNSNGQINLNVRLDSDAVGDVTMKVQGIGSQFGAAADQEFVGATPKAAEGLPASSNIATATTTVKAAAPAAPVAISAVLSGTNNGGLADKLKVDAPSAANGATVRLYKVVDGVRKLVRTSTLGSTGNRTFTVADTNGSRVTKYIARVGATSRTLADWTNSKWVR